MRRTKEEAEITRQKILEASFEIINEKGFERMTQNDIAKKVGMTRGAVNWHFKTKDEIYLTVLEYVLDKLEQQRIDLQTDTSLTYKEKLIKLFLMPIKQVEYFQFVNRIPHYLLEDSRYNEVEERMRNNRMKFIDYLEEAVTEIEKESEVLFDREKEKIAQALYLVYEGFHSRNPWNTAMIEFNENEIWGILAVIIY